MARTRVGTLVVVDESRRLAGLLTERDMRLCTRRGSRVADRMTPRTALVVHEGPIEPDAAERVMIERKIKKLPLVTADGRLIWVVTARDLVRQRRMPFATRDSQGRLRVGAAIGATGDYLARAATASSGRCDWRDRRLPRAGGGTDSRRSRRPRHRHRARSFRRHGSRDC